MLVQENLPVFSNKINNTTTSVFSNLQRDVTNSQIDKEYGNIDQDTSNTKKNNITSYIDNSTTLVTSTLGRNSFGLVVGLNAASQEKLMEFKYENNIRKVEATYSTEKAKKFF